MQRYFETELGWMRAEEEAGALHTLCFCKAGAAGGDSPLLQETQRQVLAYLAGTLCGFSLPLAPQGTSFQKEVWQALQAIPYGETRSYQQVAAAVGRPKACRAVGSANGANPLVLVIPCHRVLRSGGALGGYAYGLDIKQELLALEQRNKK